MKRPKTAANAIFGASVMQERMKRELCRRVDKFFGALKNKKARGAVSWMREFAVWSMTQNL